MRSKLEKRADGGGREGGREGRVARAREGNTIETV